MCVCVHHKCWPEGIYNNYTYKDLIALRYFWRWKIDNQFNCLTVIWIIFVWIAKCCVLLMYGWWLLLKLYVIKMRRICYDSIFTLRIIVKINNYFIRLRHQKSFFSGIFSDWSTWSANAYYYFIFFAHLKHDFTVTRFFEQLF